MTSESWNLDAHDGSCRAAIASNNSAVTLLQTGYIRASMLTLKGSVELMRLSIHTGNSRNMFIKHPQSYQKVEEYIRLAILKTSKPKKWALSEYKESDFQILRLENVSSQDDPSPVLAAIEDGKSSKEPHMDLFSITIDSTENHDALAETSNFKSAILLYNYAITYCSLAAVHQSNVIYDTEKAIINNLYGTSLRLLARCESLILPKLIHSSVEFQSTSILLLSLLIVQATREVARQMGTFGLMDQYQHKFACVATIIRGIESIMPVLHPVAAKA